MAHVTACRLTILALAAISVPRLANARDVEICANLYRELNNAPQIIGTGGDMRRYAAEVSQQNSDIRNLRIDMRRQGCRGGSGSIVTFGKANDPVCRQMQEALDAMEDQREALAGQRNNSRSLSQPSEERVAILAAIRQNNCTPADLDAQTAIEDQERMRVRGISLPQPQPESGSSITHLGKPVAAPLKKEQEQVEFPPERPYDSSRKVRMVGPRFLPEPEIDLAHPKVAGPQPQQ